MQHLNMNAHLESEMCFAGEHRKTILLDCHKWRTHLREQKGNMFFSGTMEMEWNSARQTSVYCDFGHENNFFHILYTVRSCENDTLV